VVTRIGPAAQAAWRSSQATHEEGQMHVTTAFNRLLRLPGASVIDVSFSSEGVIVTVRLRRRRRVCGRRGETVRQLEIHDRRIKRWRHLDLGASRCVIEAELRRLRCRDCGVHLEAVPWARHAAHHTRDFEDTVAWLAQQMPRPRSLACSDRLGHGRSDL
jgi:transposase